VRLSNLNKVVVALASAGEPVTLAELVIRTKLSRNSVRTAVERVGLSDGGFPARWSLKDKIELYTPPRALEMLDITDDVAVPYVHYDDWMDRWGAIEIVAARSSERPDASTSPKELYERIHQAARVFSSLAYDLQQVKDSPDWFQRIGGKIEQKIDTKKTKKVR